MFNWFTRALILIALCLPAVPAAAEEPISMIRDAEVENTIRAYATPLFAAAGLDAQAVRVHLIKDSRLNAFVAGGLNLFLNTGLLIKAESANQVIGVIAHESGHLMGGHLARMDEALKNATTEAILAMVLGAATAAASGRGDIGGAIMMGGGDVATRGLLAYSRVQEASADQGGLLLLDRTQQSARGFLGFMEILQNEELLSALHQDPYLRTHPLTRDRVDVIRTHVETSPWSNVPPSADLEERHARMRAKLFAFLETPGRTFARFKESDTSLPARYARAIAYYRLPDMARALPAVDALIAERPLDPYFRELKGQMLFENGKAGEALEPYREAVRLLPANPLERIALGQVEVELEDPALLPDAIKNLDEGVSRETDNSFGWHLLGIAYGRSGDEGMSSYALAQEALLTGRVADLVYHAGRAERLLPRGSPAWLRIQDMKREADQMRQARRN